MLITKTVVVKWTCGTKTYYISKGYVFTKIGGEFEVNVEDLKDNSTQKVNVKCDCCEKELKPMTWQTYKSRIHKEEKYYCKKCAMKLYGTDKYKKSRLKNGKSFEQWCIENNRQNVLDRWDYELNDCKPSEVCYSSEGTNRKGYWLKCPRGIHESELRSISAFTSGQEGSIRCNQCNSFAQWGIDNVSKDFLEKYWDYDKNTVDPWKISYGSKLNIYIKCQNKDYHESYYTPCKSFIKGCRCPYCSGRSGKVHPLDSLGKYLEDNSLLCLWSDKNKKSPYEYTKHSEQKVYFKCPDGNHKDTYRIIKNSVNNNFKCPTCIRERDESFLQEKVRLHLESLMYTILHEEKCTIVPKSPKTKQNLPFDNEVKELNLIIEVHGSQHYKVEYFHKLSAKRNKTTPEYEFLKQQVRDRYKRIYAKSKEYFYLEIPYTADDKLETWKQLINDKIREITNKY